MSRAATIADVLAGKAQWCVVTGDALALLPEIPTGVVGACITDPPFSSRTHEGARSFVATGRSSNDGFADGEGLRRLVDFAPFDTREFIDAIGILLALCAGWVVATCDWRHAVAAEDAGLPLVRCGVWIKPDGAPQFTGDRPGTGWEAVGIFHPPGKKHWNGGGRHAVWTCGRDRSELHPSVKPESLVAEWVNLFSDPDALILDPFCGSGTTGVAAIKTGRRFIGIEIDEGYADIARRRIADAVPTLFQPPREPDAPLFPPVRGETT